MGSNAYAEVWIPAAWNDRQGLTPVAIGPSNTQGFCTHNLYRYQDTNGDELFHDIFEMFATNLPASEHPLTHGHDLTERESGGARRP